MLKYKQIQQLSPARLPDSLNPTTLRLPRESGQSVPHFLKHTQSDTNGYYRPLLVIFNIFPDAPFPIR